MEAEEGGRRRRRGGRGEEWIEGGGGRVCETRAAVVPVDAGANGRSARGGE